MCCQADISEQTWNTSIFMKAQPSFERGSTAWTIHLDSEVQSNDMPCASGVRRSGAWRKDGARAAGWQPSTLSTKWLMLGWKSVTSSTRTLLKQVPESEWGGPDRHPHWLPTLAHMWHQGHQWDREHPAGCAKWGCTAVTTRPHSKWQSRELAQVPREKNPPVSILIELTKPQLLGLSDTSLQSIKPKGELQTPG